VEDTDFTRPLGDWVLREALRQKRVWKAQGLDITVCVNVFGHHLQQADFIERFTEILAEFPDVPANGLDLEILETTAMHDLEAVSRRIQECARLGVDFALDDFGTGYSSLTYFRHLPVTFLKIDRSFVADILDNAEDQALVESLIGMAHALNRKVIAEGVETVEHGIPLLRYGCDYAQGFGIARPMPADEVIPWIDAWRLPESWKAAIDSGPFKTK
jgi:EAL domain-containing protein (putative c-di-GMP-specific phosphodiesterase class I)